MRLLTTIFLLAVFAFSRGAFCESTYAQSSNDQRALMILVGGASDSKMGFVRSNLKNSVKKLYQTRMPGLRIEYRTWTAKGGGPSGGYDEIARTIRHQRAEWKRLKVPTSKTRVVVIGHSYGGGTALYGVKRIYNELPKIDALVTLDPVSRLEVKEKPPNVKYWLHVFADNSGSWNNLVVSNLGGHWGNTPYADRTIKARGGTDHVDVLTMFSEVQDDVWDALNGKRPRSIAQKFDENHRPPAYAKFKDYEFTHRRVSNNAKNFSKNFYVPQNARLATKFSSGKHGELRLDRTTLSTQKRTL